MRRSALVLFALLIFGLAACGGQPVAYDNPRLEDLDTLCRELEGKHKDVYHTLSKEEFLSMKEGIAAKVDDLSEVEFYFEMKKLVSAIGDAHTNLSLQPSAHDHLRPIPVYMDIIDGDWYVQGIAKEYEKYLGWQVTAIGGVPIAEVLERMAPYNSHENQTILEERCAADLAFIDALKVIGATDNLEEADYTFKDRATGTEEAVAVASFDGKAVFDAEIVLWQTESLKASMWEELYLAREYAPGIYAIQYNACAEDENYPLKQFAKDIRADIAGKPYAKVVVDLRQNGGGNSALFKPVIDALKGLQGEQGFAVYVLIGRETYSSAILNAVELKESLGATYVGAPTGGNLNHFGEIKDFDLPNFPARVYYSTKYFNYDPGYEGDSIRPDIAIAATYEDVVAGVDREMEAVVAAQADCYNSNILANQCASRRRSVSSRVSPVASIT